MSTRRIRTSRTSRRSEDRDASSRYRESRPSNLRTANLQTRSRTSTIRTRNGEPRERRDRTRDTAHQRPAQDGRTRGARHRSSRGRRRPSALSVPIVAGVVAVVLVFAGIMGVRRVVSARKQASETVEEEPQKSAEELARERVERTLEGLTLEQKIAQVFVVTPEAITGVGRATIAGTTTREALAKYPVGGLVYFAGNFQDRAQTLEMLHNSQNYSKDASGLPLFTCVDEEGGTVVRIADNEEFGLENVGDMRAIGEEGDEQKAREAAYTVGTYLVDLGLNVNFAPVADAAESEDDSLYLRSFANKPADVSPYVVAQVQGFEHAGVISCVKHFPGIGGAEGDSHNGRIYSHATQEELLKGSVVPFKAAIDENVPMVMVGHISCLELGNGEGDRPASLSKSVIGGLLRGELAYDGLVITDSLSMEAVSDYCDPSEQAVLAIQAGADLVLMPTDFEQAYRGLLRAVKNGDVDESRLDESLRRIIAAKLEYLS